MFISSCVCLFAKKCMRERKKIRKQVVGRIVVWIRIELLFRCDIFPEICFAAAVFLLSATLFRFRRKFIAKWEKYEMPTAEQTCADTHKREQQPNEMEKCATLFVGSLDAQNLHILISSTHPSFEYRMDMDAWTTFDNTTIKQSKAQNSNKYLKSKKHTRARAHTQTLLNREKFTSLRAQHIHERITLCVSASSILHRTSYRNGKKITRVVQWDKANISKLTNRLQIGFSAWKKKEIRRNRCDVIEWNNAKEHAIKYSSHHSGWFNEIDFTVCKTSELDRLQTDCVQLIDNARNQASVWR